MRQRGDDAGQSSHRGNFLRANYLDGPRGAGGMTETASWIRTLPDPDGDGFSDHEGLMQWFVNYATNTWPGGVWVRKASAAGGSGGDPDPNRQKGYGYKYLEWESLYGGWIDSVNSPATAPWNDYPHKPVATYSGTAGFPVHQLAFVSSAFSDPQGAATYAAHEWRLAEVYGPGIPGHVSGTPNLYEIQTVWSSGELTATPGSLQIPAGVTQPGKTYRVRVRHKDSDGNWSYWSDPVQFAATAPLPSTLMHYWNFNSPANLLAPSRTIGGGILSVSPSSTFVADTGQSFAAANARDGEPAASHLRVNNPLSATVTLNIPTTGHRDILVQYETRRSGQGAGTQSVYYSVDGASFIPFASFFTQDAAPAVIPLDFSAIPAANDNPLFAVRVLFQQGAGGTAGNNRFDNLTVEGNPILTGFDAWRAAHFTHPADLANPAVSGAGATPAGDGVPNLIRYALNVGPYAPVAGLLPVLARDSGPFIFRFRYDSSKADLVWKVTASNDLSGWSHVLFDSRTSAVPPLENGWLPVSLPPHLGSGPDADPRIFTRLEVMRVP